MTRTLIIAPVTTICPDGSYEYRWEVEDQDGEDFYITPEIVDEMREWVLDCEWGDSDLIDFRKLPADRIIAGIHAHYSDGLAGWFHDSTPHFDY